MGSEGPPVTLVTQDCVASKEKRETKALWGLVACRDPKDLLGPLVTQEEMAEMGKTAILVIPETRDPQEQLETKAPREYKDPLETLDPPVLLDQLERLESQEERAAGEALAPGGSKDRGGPPAHRDVTECLGPRARLGRTALQVQMAPWGLLDQMGLLVIVDQKVHQEPKEQGVHMDHQVPPETLDQMERLEMLAHMDLQD